MHSFEAFLSLLFFTIILLSIDVPETPPDDSLYLFQLAQDSWRVLYLRGDLDYLSDPIDSQRLKIETDLARLGNYSGFCFFLEGINFTNCRSGEKHQISMSMTKTLVYNTQLKKCTFSVSPR